MENCIHKNLEGIVRFGKVQEINKEYLEQNIFNLVTGYTFLDGVYICKDCSKKLRINIATIID